MKARDKDISDVPQSDEEMRMVEIREAYYLGLERQRNVVDSDSSSPTGWRADHAT